MTNFIDLEAIAQQGPVFWAACLSVALGLAMIAAATVVQTRRLGRRFSTIQAENSPLEVPSVIEKPEPAPAVEDKPAAMVTPVMMPQKSTMAPVTARLERLLGRLDKVADRLDLAEAIGPIPGEPTELPEAGESDLKQEAQGVEYVFRAAGG